MGFVKITSFTSFPSLGQFEPQEKGVCENHVIHVIPVIGKPCFLETKFKIGRQKRVLVQNRPGKRVLGSGGASRKASLGQDRRESTFGSKSAGKARFGVRRCLQTRLRVRWVEIDGKTRFGIEIGWGNLGCLDGGCNNDAIHVIPVIGAV